MQYGSTPLHKAAEKGQYEVVAVLLSYSADGTLQDKVCNIHVLYCYIFQAMIFHVNGS